MAWCFEDERDEYSDQVLGTLAMESSVVPAVWPLEVANVLLTAERRKRLKVGDSTRFIGLLADLPIVVDDETAGRALGAILAAGRKFGLPSYDGAYLELALRRGLPLATRDRALRSALEHAGGSVLRF